ncbi:MAG: ABC transporter ATP-binding protein [Deltaproteobacteria bacterium]|nr:ABC transporter ATP-binding protein [Deltaproteobacteria bacterium]
MAASIHTRGLSKAYRSGKTTTAALRGVSLGVAPGEFAALIGPDGAGKTTLIKILCGMIPFDGGTVEILGVSLPGGASAIKHRIGYLSQRFALYGNLTVEENVRYFARVFGVADYGARMRRLLDAVDLARFSDRLAKNLSGGMKQKLGVVCGLIHSPEILFLDEPTTGVDPVSRRDLFDVVEEMVGAGLTVFMATAYMDEAERAARIIMCHDGRVIADGTAATLAVESGCTAYDVISADPERVLGAFDSVAGVRCANAVGSAVHLVTDAAISESDLRSRLGGFDARIARPRLTMEDLFVGRVARETT